MLKSDANTEASYVNYVTVVSSSWISNQNMKDVRKLSGHTVYNKFICKIVDNMVSS